MGFISPHLRTYETLGAGERQKFITRLSSEAGSSENTLRRFIAAAAFLEASGLTSIPPGLKTMPVGSVEAIARISKRDPVQGQKLLKELTQGVWSIASLKRELTLAAERGVAKRPATSRDHAPENLMRLAAQCKAGVRKKFGEEMFVLPFRDRPASPVRFDAVAEPQLVLSLPRHRQLVVFDEARLSWWASAQRAKREFLRSVVMAAAMFDFVIVFTSALGEELTRCTGALRADSRERIWIEQGPPSARSIDAAVTRLFAIERLVREP